LDAGKTLLAGLFPRSTALTRESEETTGHVLTPSTNATKLLDKGKWSSSLSNTRVGALLLVT
jgi:hypothetical protein